MTKHFELPADGPSSLQNFEEFAARHQVPSIADYWQNAVARQNNVDRCKHAVEVLRRELDQVCAEIVSHGCNAERLNQTRMLELSLRQARGQFELASEQLDKAITMLRRAHAGRPESDASRTT